MRTSNATAQQSPSANGSTSPLSPILNSRREERAELQNLNDRLVSYIERVRYLEAENNRLDAIVAESDSNNEREKCNLEQMFESKLSELRNSVNELTPENSKLRLDVRRLLSEKDELTKQFATKCKEAQISMDVAQLYKSNYNEILNQKDATIAEHKKLVAEMKNSKLEFNKLRKRFEENCLSLQSETLARIDLETTVRNLREELTFSEQIRNGELNKSISRRQLNISDIHRGLADEYNVQLKESLEELRCYYEERMQSNRKEIESMFDTKMKNEHNSVQRENKSLSVALANMRSRIDDSNARVGELEEINQTLNARIRDIQLALDGERARSAESECEMKVLRDEVALQLAKYQDLMDVKVSLDLELAAYDKLLCGEEYRLKYEPATKRNRSEYEIVYDNAVTTPSTGVIEIVEVDPMGKFFKLHNKSETEVSLDGWQFIRKSADGADTVLHRFDATVQMDGNANLTIWSADSGSVSDSPGNIVMMGSTDWCFGEVELNVSLTNGDGREQATARRIRKKRLRRRFNVDQQRDAEKKRGKCCVM